MIIWYTDKVENKDLGYCLYLDLANDNEFWYDYQTSLLHYSKDAGDSKLVLVSNYTLKVRS